jgi:peptidoglycan/LPS O-acetylase OafA/YrhL
LARIPTLDGWRGIAILLVLVTHFQRSFLGDYRWSDLGQHGVQIFFVLSGYLITSHLLGEQRINLRAFYVRRAFRILPTALTYLSVLILLTALTPFKVCGIDIWACLLLFRNYVMETSRITCTEHFWSLSMEEQFYLFWPAMLVLFGRLRASVLAGLIVLGIAVFRIFNWSLYTADLRFLHTEVRADGLLIGSLLALAFAYSPVRACAGRWAIWVFWPVLLVFVLDTFRFNTLIPLHESLAIAVLLGATSLRPKMLFSRALEWDCLKTTGALSYSIYIWQGLFLRPNWGILWPFLLVGSFLLSYVLIERPARRLGRKLAGRTLLPLVAECKTPIVGAIWREHLCNSCPHRSLCFPAV